MRYAAASEQSDGPVPGPSATSNGTASILRGLRSVVAEDEGVTQVQLRRILRSQGVEVVGLASTGTEAVSLIRQHRPDFVLMDIRMPEMDGLDAAREVLKDGPLCIIVLTAFSDDEYREQAMDIGASGYILKPVTSDMLIPQIESALKRFRQPIQ